MVTIAADGSSIGNPGPSGWAWVVSETCWAAGGWRKGTNNQGELYAVYDALKQFPGQDLHFLCDSRYTIDSITKWRAGWKARNWRRANGEPVKNLKLIQAIDEALEAAAAAGNKITFEWVRGHSGHPLNEAADSRAVAVSQAYAAGRTPGTELCGPGNTITPRPAPDPAAQDTTAQDSAAPDPVAQDTTAQASAAPDLTAQAPARKDLDPKAPCAPDTRIQALADGRGDLRCDTIGASYRHGEYTINEHWLTVPLDHTGFYRPGSEGLFNAVNCSTITVPAAPSGRAGRLAAIDPEAGEINIFAREIIHPDSVNKPYAIFFQGGPGCPGTRPEDWSAGWIGELTKHFRLIMFDQRGTGNSTPLETQTLGLLGDRAYDWLRHMRADQIVFDAEALRRALGVEQWTVVGQSFGGFIITAYLSRYPQAISRALVTCGLPGLADIDTVYRATYAKTAARCEKLYANVPIEKTIREVAAHLLEVEELLPDGSVLTPTLLRSVGKSLGRTPGFMTLANLFENPFVTIGSQRRLSQAFRYQVYAHINSVPVPLYFLIHETIYANAVAGAGATNWGADRIRAEIPGFAIDADPLDESQPYYLTGEHYGPWTLAGDANLAPLLPLGERLAAETQWPVLYDPAILEGNRRPIAAAQMVDDIFVPVELARATGEVLGASIYESTQYQHDAVHASGTAIIRELLARTGVLD